MKEGTQRILLQITFLPSVLRHKELGAWGAELSVIKLLMFFTDVVQH